MYHTQDYGQNDWNWHLSSVIFCEWNDRQRRESPISMWKRETKRERKRESREMEREEEKDTNIQQES